MARRKMVLDWTMQRYFDRHDLRTLDAGRGTGLMLQQLLEMGGADGVDTAGEALDFYRKRGPAGVWKADVLRLPFGEESYDVVAALDLLELIDDDRRWDMPFGAPLCVARKAG